MPVGGRRLPGVRQGDKDQTVEQGKSPPAEEQSDDEAKIKRHEGRAWNAIGDRKEDGNLLVQP